MRIAALWVLLATAGCDKVLGLHEIEQPSVCPALDPDLDADGDQQLNGVDDCPTVPYQTAEDEDGDGALDACDLCPQLAGDAAAGDDPDCDGLGAACDPDSTIAHDRRFFGFATSQGIELEDPAKDGTIDAAATQLHFVLHNINTTSTITVNDKGAAVATYETRATMDNALVPVFWNFTIRLDDAASHRYEIQLEKFSSNKLVLVIEDVDAELVNTSVGTLDSNRAEIFLRAETHADGISGTVTINGLSQTVTATAPVTAPVEYGIFSFRGNTTPDLMTDIRVDYLVYTAVRP